MVDMGLLLHDVVEVSTFKFSRPGGIFVGPRMERSIPEHCTTALVYRDVKKLHIEECRIEDFGGV